MVEFKKFKLSIIVFETSGQPVKNVHLQQLNSVYLFSSVVHKACHTMSVAFIFINSNQ
jgi:hypothetical protein